MGNIKILDEALINKIAAGEVVERPASVVKELVENSLDAGATDIVVEIISSGRVLIKVIDNGIGMSKEDALLSVERHATSKISDVNDLFKISTLGFRGEALASISAVSTTTIETRCKDSDIGFKFIVKGGDALSVSNIARSIGTTISVENLFFNVPARRKFLKSDSTELNRITEVINSYALLNFDVSFKLINDGKVILNAPKVDTLIDRVYSVFGLEVSKNMFFVDYVVDSIKITGVTSKPSVCRATSDNIFLFVNGRFVKSKLIVDAIVEAYHTLLFLDRYPIVVLNIDIDYSKVDVNVHPSKKLIKFDDDAFIFNIIFDAFSKAISSTNLIPDVSIYSSSFDNNKKTLGKLYYNKFSGVQESLETYTPSSESISDDAFVTLNKCSNLNNNSVSRDISLNNSSTSSINLVSLKNNLDKSIDTSDSFDGCNLDKHSSNKSSLSEGIVDNTLNSFLDNIFDIYYIYGQLNKLYILCASKKGLVLIDQHAAQERVFYERYMEQLFNKSVKIQSLIVPFEYEFSLPEYNLIKDNLDLLKSFGFILESFGNRSFILRSLPSLFGKIDRDIFLKVVSLLKSGHSSSVVNSKIEDKIASMACRSAIKAGDELTLVEMKKLIVDLSNLEKPYACPHGRPTMIRFSFSDLEKMFKRTA